MTARPLVALLAPALASACLLGCGGGASTEPSEAASGATEPTGAPTVPEVVTMRQAIELAKAVNLRAEDVPYFEEEPEEPESEEDTARERRLKRDFGRCLGGLDLSEHLVEHESPSFDSSSAGEVLSVQSAVEVLSTTKLAERRARAYRSRRGQRCFRRLLIPAFEEEGSSEVEIGEARITRLPPPLPGVEGSFGYRIATTATATGAQTQLTAYEPGPEAASPRTIPFYIDLLAFTVGPAEVDLIAMGSPTPVSRNLERNLLTVLHDRAVANLP